MFWKIRNRRYFVFKLITNSTAKELVKLDLKVLDYIKNKNVITLNKAMKQLELSKIEVLSSLKRLSSLKVMIKQEFFKEIEIK